MYEECKIINKLPDVGMVWRHQRITRERADILLIAYLGIYKRVKIAADLLIAYFSSFCYPRSGYDIDLQTSMIIAPFFWFVKYAVLSCWIMFIIAPSLTVLYTLAIACGILTAFAPAFPLLRFGGRACSRRSRYEDYEAVQAGILG